MGAPGNGGGRALGVAALVAACGFMTPAAPAGAASGWTPQTSGTTMNLHGVAFVGDSYGWAVGDGGTILATSNGGSTWTPQTSGTSSNLFSVAFPDLVHGWAVGANGTILYTGDGGSTWTPQSSGFGSDNLVDITAPDSMHAWISGWGRCPSPCNRIILGTSNAGTLWTMQNSHGGYGIAFSGDSYGWAVDGVGSIVATTNGGSMWNPQTSGTSQDLGGVAFSGISDGWAVGFNGTILGTTNGGGTWTPETSGTTSNLGGQQSGGPGVAFPDAMHGITVGTNGTIVATTNGGSSWTTQASGTTRTLYAVAYPDDSHAWAVGDGGTLLAYTAPSTGPPGGVYNPVTPFRVWDTRAGSQVQCPGGCTLGPGSTHTVQITGMGSPAVPSNATAVVANLGGIQPTNGTFLSVAPAGSSTITSSSNLNLNPGAVQANLVMVALSSTGAVDVYNSQGSVDAILDVEGYFTPSPATPATTGTAGTFHPAVPPARVCDTRANSGTLCSSGSSDNPLGPGQSRLVQLTGGAGGMNADIAAVVFNITAVSGTAGTYLTAYPPAAGGSCPVPSTSNLNVSAGVNLPNRVIVPVGIETGGQSFVCIYNAQGSVNFIVDLNGSFGTGAESAPGALFYPVNPQRICDTRAGTGNQCTGRSITPRSTLVLSGIGSATGDPASPVAVVANTTAIQGTAPTFLSLFPDGNAPSGQLTSDLNPGGGQIIANLVVVALGTTGGNTGKADVYNDQGTIDVALDAEGWFQ